MSWRRDDDDGRQPSRSNGRQSASSSYSTSRRPRGGNEASWQKVPPGNYNRRPTSGPLKKVGIYFGSFDPIHENHFHLARYMIDSNQADIIVFVPNAESIGKSLSSTQQRVTLLQLRCDIENEARGKDNAFRLFKPSVSRQGGWAQRSQTCHDLRTSLQREFPGARFSMLQLIGQDSFERPSAQDALTHQGVLKNLKRTLVVLPRLKLQDDGTFVADAVNVPQHLRSHVRVESSYRDPVAVSSTQIRIALRTNRESCPVGLHQRVYQSIIDQGAYMPPSLSEKFCIVGIAGSPGSGKSSFAHHICELFSDQVAIYHLSGGNIYRFACESDVETFARLNQALSGRSKEYLVFLDWVHAKFVTYFKETLPEKSVILYEVKPPNMTSEALPLDILFYLEASPEVCRSRMEDRQRSEDTEKRLASFAKRLPALHTEIKEQFYPTTRVNASLSIEDYMQEAQVNEKLDELFIKRSVAPSSSQTGAFPSGCELATAALVQRMLHEFEEEMEDVFARYLI